MATIFFIKYTFIIKVPRGTFTIASIKKYSRIIINLIKQKFIFVLLNLL